MLKISCSNLFRYSICPAALNHEQTYVEKEKTKYAEEGIAKHLEMQEAIEGTAIERSVAAEELRQEFLKIEPNFSFDDCVCEEKLSIGVGESKDGEEPLFVLVGKPDLIYISKYTNTIYVIDYKFGYMSVEVKDNPQLTGYMLLLMDQFDITTSHKKIGIFQNGRLELKLVLNVEVSNFEDNLCRVVQDSQKNIYTPSATACRWCSYREECPALNMQVNTAVKKITETDLQQLSEPDMFQFRKFLMLNKKLIEYVMGDAETYFKNSLKKGGFHDFCSLKSNGSVQSWSDDLNEDEIAAKLSEISGKDKNDFYQKKLLSVAQIKKLAEIPADLIVTKDKVKSLKIKEAHELKTATDELF